MRAVFALLIAFALLLLGASLLYRHWHGTWHWKALTQRFAGRLRSDLDSGVPQRAAADFMAKVTGQRKQERTP